MIWIWFENTDEQDVVSQSNAGGTAYPGCQVAFIAVGPAVGQARSDEYVTHYSLLRTTEEMLGALHL